jgi:hypothetical protein
LRAFVFGMNKAMVKFKRDLLRWDAYIRRLAHLTTLEVEDLPGSEFALVGKWDGGEHRKVFDRRYVMGRWCTSPPLQQRPHMRVCRFRDDFIRSVLHARGV